MKRTQVQIDGVLLAMGMVLLTVYLGSRVQAALLSRLAVRSFEAMAVRIEPISTNTKLDRNVGSFHTDFTLWSKSRIEAYRLSLAQHFPVPLAVLRISSIQLEVPVLKGTDPLTLNRGVGWIIGTTPPNQLGNIGIAGHRDGFFRGLKDLKIGDDIELETRDKTYTFAVDNLQVVDPHDISVLAPSAPSLTLVTCFPFYAVGNAPQRYIIHASRTDPESHISTIRGDKQVYVSH